MVGAGRIVDALSWLKLLCPRRATVSIYPVEAGAAAALSTEVMKRNIKDLCWRECTVRSVFSIGVDVAASSPYPSPPSNRAPPSCSASPLRAHSAPPLACLPRGLLTLWGTGSWFLAAGAGMPRCTRSTA